MITCGAQDGISVADTAILAVPEQLLYELVLDFIYLFFFNFGPRHSKGPILKQISAIIPVLWMRKLRFK